MGGGLTKEVAGKQLGFGACTPSNTGRELGFQRIINPPFIAKQMRKASGSQGLC